MFGDKLKELRKNKGLSQDQLGEKFGVAGNTISNWETNSTQPPFEAIKKIATFFDVTPNYLFGFSNDDYDKIEKLEVALKNNGITDTMTALRILEILKNKD